MESLLNKNITPIMIIFHDGKPIHITTNNGYGYDIEYCKRDSCLYWELTSSEMVVKEKLWVPCGGDIWLADGGYAVDEKSRGHNKIITERPDPYKTHPSEWEDFEMSDMVYCAICDDWLPGEQCYTTENGHFAVCDHVWWVNGDGWTGPGLID